jgi:paraquat-inducible protein A
MTLGGRRFLLGSAVLAASLCLALGVSLPVIKLSRLVFFTYEHSIVSAVNALMRSSQPFLGTVVLISAVFLPVMKLLYLVLLVALPLRDVDRLAVQLRALEWIGKWSPQDVLVLSLTMLFIWSQGAYAVAIAGGAYFFAATVLLMMLAYAWLPADVSALPARASAARASTLRSLAFGLVVALAAALFAMGVTLPAVRFTGTYAGANQHSIATIVLALYARGELLLWSVIFTLAILLPLLKLLYLLVLIVARYLPYSVRTKSILALEWLGRHSTADVMVLALMVFYVNASGYAEAALLPGAYLFAASALVTMVVYGWANSAAPDATAQPSSLQARLAGLSSVPPQRRGRAG